MNKEYISLINIFSSFSIDFVINNKNKYIIKKLNIKKIVMILEELSKNLAINFIIITENIPEINTPRYFLSNGNILL